MKAGRKRKKIPLFDLKVSPQARKQVRTVLKSGWLTTGPVTEALEAAMARYLGIKHIAAVNSATAGLYLALRALGVGKGDSVVTTPFTFIATVEAILLAGAQPLFADIEPRTLNIDPQKVTSVIRKNTKVILPVDIAGFPADYARLTAIGRDRSLYLLADSAHAIATRIGNRTPAHFADAAVYSLYSTKNLTCGEGGLVVSRRKSLADRVRRLARHGLTSGTYERQQKKRWDYDAVEFGFKANMSDVHAAIGLGQLTRLEQDQTKREGIAKRYARNLSDYGEFLQLPPDDPRIRHGRHLYIIRLDLSRLKIDRDRFIRLMADRGIECGVHYKPVFELSYYRKSLRLSNRSFPNAAAAGRSVVSLPLYPGLSPAETNYICQSIVDILRAHSR
ncbi:MAG: DegT/DnrJ/EryC1/StrS family aminotransferase [Candidatus Zixiibacteriota bacterium]